ncbi:50S ribosomal protein L21 [Trichothermofontia sp.]
MTYAIIETGGKQLRVEPGRFYDVERLAVDEDATVTIDRVLLVQHDGEVTIGRPIVNTATVEAKVLGHRRGRKIIVYKMRPKKKTRKKQGHRQELTRLLIQSIHLNGAVLAAADAPATLDEEAAIPVEVTVETQV